MQTGRNRKTRGISLIELGVVMVVISLALVPVVQMINGGNSRTGMGSAQRMNSQRSKEIVLANSLVERALATDFSVFNCGQNFDPATSLPTTGQTVDLPANSRCTDNTYSTPLYYQWTVRNTDMSGSIMPVGNHYYQVALGVYREPAGGAPILTLPTSLFWNETGMATSSNRTGIVIVQDISGSMSWGKDSGTPDTPPENNWGQAPTNRASSPYLKYRYQDPSYPAYAVDDASLLLDLNNNAQLDIVSAMNSNNPSTPWDDRYIGPGILGIPVRNAGINSGRPFDCTDDNAGANSPWWSDDRLPWDLQGSNQYRNHVSALCEATLYSQSSANWQNLMDDNMSRIEAARSSLLSFLLSIEADPDLYQNTRLGFITFESGVQTRVPMESVNAGNRYSRMRRTLSWINRNGPGIIAPAGSTNMYGGLQEGARMAFADATLDNRIIFFIGDGEPTVAPTNHAAFQNLATQIGNGTFPGSNGNSATIFTLGLLSDDPDLPTYLRDDIARRTPGGQYFFAQNMADVRPIFDQIKYQIQRVILLNRSNRYNVDFT